MLSIDIQNFISSFLSSPLGEWSHLLPWQLTAQSVSIVRELINTLSTDDYLINDDIAVHRSATVEPASILKGPLIIGANTFIAGGAYVRGGCWIAERCIIGPGAELKSSFIFAGAKLAHFNFVGDSLLGQGVNLEAGSIICNYRNECPSREILVRLGSSLYPVGSEKFGALIGDNSRIGANAVIAPGAILKSSSVIRRTALCDQETTAHQADQ